MAKFQKGQSGNPGGRPKRLHEVRAMARAHTFAVIKVLKAIALDKSKDDAVRVAAAKEILDRGWGRPVQVQGVAMAVSPMATGEEFGKSKLTGDIEKARRLAFMLAAGVRAQDQLMNESDNVIPIQTKQEESDAA